MDLSHFEYLEEIHYNYYGKNVRQPFLLDLPDYSLLEEHGKSLKEVIVYAPTSYAVDRALIDRVDMSLIPKFTIFMDKLVARCDPMNNAAFKEMKMEFFNEIVKD